MKTEWVKACQMSIGLWKMGLREAPIDEKIKCIYHYKDGQKFCCEAVYTFTQNKKKYTVHGFSICSESQNFNKKIGRMIAEGRAIRLGGLIQDNWDFGYIGEYIQKQKVRNFVPLKTKENLAYFAVNRESKVYYTVEEEENES